MTYIQDPTHMPIDRSCLLDVGQIDFGHITGFNNSLIGSHQFVARNE